jgi:hypothetical protein
MEKKMKQERRKRDRKFFEEMEKNIMKSLQRGEVIPGIPYKETKKEGPPKEPLPKTRVRTISGMDDFLLAELRDDHNNSSANRRQVHNQTLTQQRQQQQVTFNNNNNNNNNNTNKITSSSIGGGGSSSIRSTGRPPLSSSRQVGTSSQAQQNGNDDIDMILSPDIEKNTKATHGQQPLPSAVKQDLELAGEKFLDAPVHTDSEWREMENELSAPTGEWAPGCHIRRNTGGTIYLQNTMTNPDIQATIKCVCGVYRAHIVQAKEEERHRYSKIDSSLSKEYSAFNDCYWTPNERTNAKVPPLTEVVEFYDAFYRRSQMEHDTIITSLIYVERVIKCTNGVLTPNLQNWRSLLFACMVLASKVWDDLSMWNVDFSNVSAHTAGLSAFTLRRINQLELELLKCLKFDVKVAASEYAKYYFLIRTMLLRSGLVKEDEKPLQKRDAFRKLESLTQTYLKQTPEKTTRDRRSKSMDESFSSAFSKDELGPGPVLKDSVCLEQLIGQ